MHPLTLPPVTDLAGRVVAPAQAVRSRPPGPWDGNRPPVVGDRVLRTGTVQGITICPTGGHRVAVLDDAGGVTDMSLSEFVRIFRTIRRADPPVAPEKISVTKETK